MIVGWRIESRMEKKDVLTALKRAKENSNKRNFKQTVDLIITLRDIDLKKPDNQVDLFVSLHNSIGRQTKICGLVGGEMVDNAKKELDFVIDGERFDEYGKDKKKIKKLASEYHFFVAQANLMPKVAAAFGRVLGPRNKMPNPKSGCIVPPNANLSALKQKLEKTVRILIRTVPQYQIAVGKDEQPEEEVADNILTIYDQLIHHLPGEENNIKSVFVKLTMGPTIKVVSEKSEKAKEAKGKVKK
jgi:large subunit ribosomal protein L1